jgi:putative transcriptional regulator
MKQMPLSRVTSSETLDDAPPMTAAELAKAWRVPRVKTVRITLGLTPEEFAERYKIPLGTLRDWEQSRVEPDAPARAYIHVIAGDPDGVVRSLARAPKRPA